MGQSGHRVQRLTVNRIWGLGVYVNPDSYRYVALQLGPLWLYVWHEAGCYWRLPAAPLARDADHTLRGRSD